MIETLKILNELQKIGLIEDYAIGGKIATIYYIEPILTYDLDVFIILPKNAREGNLVVLLPLFKYLTDRGYKWKGEYIIIEGIPVRFIPVDNLEEEAVKNAKEIKYEGIKTKIMKVEYLIPLLLRAGRKKDIEKVEKLLEQIEIDMRKLEDIL